MKVPKLSRGKFRETCSSCIHNFTSRVPNAQNQLRSRGTVRSIKVWEGHLNAAQPNFCIRWIIKIKNYTHIHCDTCVVLSHGHDQGNTTKNQEARANRFCWFPVLHVCIFCNLWDDTIHSHCSVKKFIYMNWMVGWLTKIPDSLYLE